MVGQRWVIALVVVVGVVLALAIAGLPSGGSGNSGLPVVTDQTTPSTSFTLDTSVPTIPPRSNLPNSVLSSTTTTPR